MKVKVEFVVDVDPSAWRYRFDQSFGMVYEADVRESVKKEIAERVTKELREAGLLIAGS